MLSMKICVAFLVLVLCVIDNAQALEKLSIVYENLPAEIKTILDKYEAQNSIDYGAFFTELTGDAKYDEFKTVMGIQGDITESLFITIFDEYLFDIRTTTKANVETTTTMTPVKLADVYDGLSPEIKAVFDKFKNKTDVNYAEFLSELTGTTGYDDLKTKLMITDDPTFASLQTLFEEYINPDNNADTNADTDKENNSMRNGVTLVSVVMVSVMSMLIAYLN